MSTDTTPGSGFWVMSSGVNDSGPSQTVAPREPTCRVFWRSHGCDLPRFHDGDSYSHECEPCPPDCDASVEVDMLGGEEGVPWMADHCGLFSVHCGSRPSKPGTEYPDQLSGDDVEFFAARDREHSNA